MKIIFSQNFRVPFIILFGIIVYLFLKLYHFNQIANILAMAITILGSYTLFIDAYKDILQKHFALDYIAILAIIVSLVTGNFLVASILALMISSGNTLEEYALNQAKKSLTALSERIPHEVLLWEDAKPGNKIKIEKAKIGDEIFVRKGEVIPLDGKLITKSGLMDESTLTGESIYVEKFKDDFVFSGTVNVGNPIAIRVTKPQSKSTYSKIVELVKSAQKEKSPMVRLADKYSNGFTIITFVIATLAYFSSNFSLTAVLSVLAIATPCPLIIATPIALLGGVNLMGKKRIIVKKLAALETLSKINTIIFDKTGTLTIGKPKLTEIKNLSKNLSEKEILSLADALERNSLHPLAKAVVEFAKSAKAPILHAQNVLEIVGKGISGQINNKKYAMTKLKNDIGMTIELKQGSTTLALFKFEDRLKEDSKTIIERLKNMGLQLSIYTGDKKESAQKIASQLDLKIDIKAESSPKDKMEGVLGLQKSGRIVAMIGDGINDAPALALADVGMVFSNEEQTASSEAADIVFLGGNFSQVLESLEISKRTIEIARQSIIFGIGLSITGMLFALFGKISPLYGAGLQEVIDVAVILNAIRASR